MVILNIFKSQNYKYLQDMNGLSIYVLMARYLKASTFLLFPIYPHIKHHDVVYNCLN